MTRVEIELSSGEVRPLDSVIGAQGMEERQEAVNRALALLEWAIRERAAGRRVSSEQEQDERYRVILLSDLTRAADSSKASAEKGVSIPIRRKK